MNILHVNFDDTGGAAIASRDLHDALIKQGIDSNYLALNLTEQYSKESNYFSHRRIYKLFFEKLYYLYLKAWLVATRNTNILKQGTPANDTMSTPYSCFDITKDPLYKKADIIHFHWTARFLDWPTFFKKNKKPVIWTLHDRNPFSGISHCKTDFPSGAKAIEAEIVNKKKNWTKNSNITIISPSNEYKKACMESPIFEHCNKEVIAHGIPSDIFFPMEKNDVRIKHGLPTDKKIVLSVASDINRKLKGFKEIIAIAKKMPDIIFILVGTKSKQIEEESNIIYTGQINDRSILNEWYNCADVTISNSEEESFGLSIAESLKTGTPTIMRKTGLFRDIINEKNGLSITTTLYEAINVFYTKSYNKDEIINSVRDDLDTKTCAVKYISVYEKV